MAISVVSSFNKRKQIKNKQDYPQLLIERVISMFKIYLTLEMFLCEFSSPFHFSFPRALAFIILISFSCVFFFSLSFFLSFACAWWWGSKNKTLLREHFCKEGRKHRGMGGWVEFGATSSFYIMHSRLITASLMWLCAVLERANNHTAVIWFVFQISFESLFYNLFFIL